MPTFKLALKLLYKNLPVLLINIIAFTGIALLMGSFYNGGSEEIVKANVAVIDEEHSVIVETFKTSLNDIAIIKEIKTDKKSMQDALYYGSVDYILIFPVGYSESFFTADRISPEKMTLPNSFASVQIENRFSLFVNTASVYYDIESNLHPEKSGAELFTAVLENTANDINQKVNIEIMQTWKTKELFRFRTYCMFGLMTLFSVIGNIIIMPMITIKKKKIMQRNLCSPASSKRLNLEILLAVGLLFVAAIIFYILIGAAIFGNAVFSAQGLWMCFNTVILGFCYLGICFLISVLVKSNNAINFAATALSLTFCFAGGAFVPQELMSKGFTTFGKMTPGYWYVNNIETAYLNQSISGKLLGTMLGQMGIVLAFGLACLMIGLVVQKFKSRKAA